MTATGDIQATAELNTVNSVTAKLNTVNSVTAKSNTINSVTAKLNTINSVTAKLVTVTERVFLYLSTFRSYRDELDAPMDITQVAIAEAVGITRGNVARAISPLLDEKLVETHKVHVPGIRMKRNAYYLTYIGRNKVKPLKERVLGTEIEVVYPEGKRMAMLVSEAQRFIPFDISVVDIVRETDKGVFDCKAFQKNRDQAERHFLGQLNRSSEPRHFYGRTEELDQIRECLTTTSCNTLVIKGIPGIGKTTLVTKALDAVPSQDMYYFNIQPWSSLRSLILSLAEFLDEHGKRELRRYLDANPTIDLSELEYLLSKGLAETSLVLVYDDLQNANTDINDFLSMLHGVIAPLSDVKLVVVGRLVEPFYSVRDVAVDRSVLVLTLEGLSPDHTMALASAVGISQDHVQNIYSQTVGHPFFVELLAHGGTDHRSDIERFIADEFMGILDKEELEMLKFISDYR